MEEESGENWPSDHSDLGMDYDVNDFGVDDEELLDQSSGGESDSFAQTVNVDEDRGGDREGTQEELTERLIALSATIPGLKNKMDYTYILEKASKYVKQLQERVRELEKQVESPFCSNNNNGTASSEMSYSYYVSSDILPEVKARVLQKEVLLIIHCEKQKGIMLKILSQLENLHLSVLNSSVLPFGKSTLDITIVAQMGDEYNMTVNELVKSLRLAILSQ